MIEREKVDIGVLITMEAPTKPMRTEAVEGGYYKFDMDGSLYPRIQILTVEELLNRSFPIKLHFDCTPIGC